MRNWRQKLFFSVSLALFHSANILLRACHLPGCSSKWSSYPQENYMCCSCTQRQGSMPSCQEMINKVLKQPMICMGPWWVTKCPWHQVLMFSGAVLMAINIIYYQPYGIPRCTAWPAFSQKKIGHFLDVFWGGREFDAVLKRMVEKKMGCLHVIREIPSVR